MDKQSLEFLKRMLETPGPSGYESEIQQVVRDYVQSFADQVTTDSHGNVIVCLNPEAEQRAKERKTNVGRQKCAPQTHIDTSSDTSLSSRTT